MRSKPKSSEEAPAYEPISWNGDSTIDQVLGSQEVASLERVDSRNRKDRGLTATVVVSRNHRLSLQAMRRKPKAVCVASYTSLAEAIRGLIERTTYTEDERRVLLESLDDVDRAGLEERWTDLQVHLRPWLIVVTSQERVLVFEFWPFGGRPRSRT